MAVDSATSRLQMYITTRTKALPDDAELYQLGGKHENTCLFCRNPNATYRVISQGKDTWTHMCNWCYDVVNRELDTYNHKEHDYFIKEKDLLASLDPQHEFVIPPDIGEYLTHLHQNDDYYINKSNRCYICNRLPASSTNSTEEFDTISIPVRTHTLILAGKVHICPDKVCAEIAAKYRSKMAQLYFLNSKSMQTELADYNCPVCTQKYNVIGAREEIFHRVTSHESIEWHCPECAYKMVQKWRDNPNEYPLHRINHKGVTDGPISREIDDLCTYCLEFITIDRLQTEFTIYHNHIMNSKVCCRECSLLKRWFELDSVCRVLNTRLYIEVHNSDFTFSVFKLKRGTLESVIVNGNTDADNSIDNMLAAHTEFIRLIGNTINLDD